MTDPKEYRKEYYRKNRQKALEQRRQYYEAHKEKIKQQSKNRSKTHKEHISEQKKLYYEENKERVLAAKKQHRLNNISQYANKDFTYWATIREAKLAVYRTERGRLTALVTGARLRCRKNGLPFDLSPDDLVVPAVCPLLSIPIELHVEGRTSPNSPSLDRIVPELGYVRGNVRVISYKANTMKSNATKEMLLEFAKNLPAYIGNA